METIHIPSLEINENSVVLDLGCGEGRHTIAVDYSFPDATIIGLDIDFASIHTAKEKHRTFNQKNSTSYIHASGYQLPFSDECIDHIICSEVLEHIPNYELFLSEIDRILKPQGYLSISIPSAWPERICWLLSKEYHSVEGGHIRIFNKKELIGSIKRKKYVFLKEHRAHALHTPYWWLRCLFWNNGKENKLSRQYHKLLVWDLIKKPRLTFLLEKALNPILGKSVVLYFKKKYDD